MARLDGKVAPITGGESGIGPRTASTSRSVVTIALGRHATPEEVGHAVLSSASDESAMVAAHTLSIDGGTSAQ